jgi:hypothetical protein
MAADFMICYGKKQLAVGECSFLKAALFSDEKTYIPEPIIEMSTILKPKRTNELDKIVYGESEPEHTILNDEITTKLIESLNIKNTTPYTIYITKETLQKFLKKGKNKRVWYELW